METPCRARRTPPDDVCRFTCLTARAAMLRLLRRFSYMAEMPAGHASVRAIIARYFAASKCSFLRYQEALRALHAFSLYFL